MYNLLVRSLFLLIQACCVLAVNGVDGTCERGLQDGVECVYDNTDDDLQKYANVHDENHVSDENIGRDQSVAKHHLSVVACGDRLNETVVMLKSAAFFSRHHFHVHIFADDELRPQFLHQLSLWPDVGRSQMTFTLYPIQFPDSHSTEIWRKLFKLCASQRIFIPKILSHIDSLVYVDTDVLFLRPLEDIWKFFEVFSDSHIAALAREHEEPTASWYARFARHPYVPPYGVNSGVMLMNLTRMRSCAWTEQMVSYFEQYRYQITWGDQDLINIFFHFFPDNLYQYGCDWNYRPDHCMYMSNCKPAELYGVSVLHGCRRAFHIDKWPIFRAVYQTIEKHQFSSDVHRLFRDMKTNIDLYHDNVDQCHRVAHVFTRQIESQLYN